MNGISAIIEHGELLSNLVSRELKSRYKSSLLGFLWSILTPLFMAVIYVFFLRLLVGRGVPTEEILIGVFAWQFTSLCVTGGMTSITGNANLVKKVYFPRLLLPSAVTAANLINYLLSLVVQFAIVAVMLHLKGGALSAWSLAVPVLILYHALFNLGLALLVGAANVYFRDTQHLVGVLLSAWFFMSPVMYNLSFVERFASASPLLVNLYLLNPMAVILTGYRTLILGTPFPLSAWAAGGALLAPLILVGAYALFQSSQRYFSDML